MSDMSEPIPEELHVLAGEYVLGALDVAEMRAVRRQAMVDPRLAAAIAGWERRLTPMAQAVATLPPPDALWSRIEETIAPLPDDAPEDEVTVIPTPRPRLATVPPSPERAVEEPERGEPQRLRSAPPLPPRRVWPWKLATAGSLALAAGVAAVVLIPSLALRAGLPLAERFAPRVAVLMPSEPEPSSASQPQMAAETGTPTLLEPRPANASSQKPGTNVSAYLAEARPDGTLILTAVAPVDVPSGKALELWILPPGGTAPKSLGVLPPAGRKVELPAMPAAGTALMVSLEPPGGSPTGAPTGPVVYAGKLGQLQL
jgi:anti-sigma-K factor RskA